MWSARIALSALTAASHVVALDAPASIGCCSRSTSYSNRSSASPSAVSRCGRWRHRCRRIAQRCRRATLAASSASLRSIPVGFGDQAELAAQRSSTGRRVAARRARRRDTAVPPRAGGTHWDDPIRRRSHRRRDAAPDRRPSRGVARPRHPTRRSRHAAIRRGPAGDTRVPRRRSRCRRRARRRRSAQRIAGPCGAPPRRDRGTRSPAARAAGVGGCGRVVAAELAQLVEQCGIGGSRNDRHRPAQTVGRRAAAGTGPAPDGRCR